MKFNKASAVTFTICTLALIVAPIFQNWAKDPIDDFPLSYYPMFTSVRNGQVYVTHAIGLKANGDDVRLRYSTYRSGGMNQVRKQLRKMMTTGRSKEVVEMVAEKVQRDLERGRRPEYEGIQEVALVTSYYDFDRFFLEDQQPQDREFHYRIPLSSTASSDSEQGPAIPLMPGITL